jgi:hypothetical protein
LEWCLYLLQFWTYHVWFHCFKRSPILNLLGI